MSLPYSVQGHTECDAPLGVVVHQRDGDPVRLPVIDDGLQLYERKVGPTEITRRAEVTVPIEGFGDDNWLSYIGAFESSSGAVGDRVAGPPSSTGIPVEDPIAPQPTLQIGDVIGQPIDGNGEPIGEPTVLFRGYVAAVGSKDGVNRAQFRIHDPSTFLDSIEAGEKFTEPRIADVLSYVIETYSNEQSVFSSVEVDLGGYGARPTRQMLGVRDILQLLVAPESGFTAPPWDPSGAALGIGERIFSTNRDTLADVVKWVSEITDVRVWFGPSDQQAITLNAVDDDSQQYDLTPSSTSLPKVIANDALYEMSPFNGLKIKGETGDRIGFGSFSVNVTAGDTYPEATATYPPLVDRLGGELITTETSNTTDTEQLEQEAKSGLKEELDTVSGGEMVTTLAPMIRPYDTVAATPACSGVTVDVDSLEYEVQEAVHSITPSDNNLPQTTLSVSMAIDPSKIETESTTKDARTGGTPSENNANDDYEYDYQTAP